MNTLYPTDAERRLIAAARVGLPADLSSANAAANEPAYGGRWGAERTIRAKIIHALATGARDDWPVHPKGIQLASARIEGQLDFGGAEIRCCLILKGCYIENPIILADATAKSISLESSSINGMQAERVIVFGFIDLNGVTSGEVSFVGAKISGQLLCRGARFRNFPGPALNADFTQIDGGVFLDDNFSAIGEVRFFGARIDGQLTCRGSNFRAAGPQAPALTLDSLRAAAGVILDQGFNAIGEVKLRHAEISPQLICSGGIFQNPNGFALSVDGLTVNGHVFLDDEFAACGKASFCGARISQDLVCNGGKFDDLILQRAQVSGILAIKNLARPEQSRIDLTHARIGLLSDDKASWPAKGNLHINGFEYNAIAPYSPRDAESRLEWLARVPNKDFSTQPYEQLEKVLRASGDERGAIKVYVAKRRAIRKKNLIDGWMHAWKQRTWWARRQAEAADWSARAWDRILYYVVGYGYRVRRVFGWSLAVVLIGAFFFWLWFWHMQAPAVVSLTVDHALWSFFYSLDVFLPFGRLALQSIHSFRHRYPGDLWFYLFAGWYVLEMLAGWLAAGLIAAAAAGVIQQ